MDLLILTSAQDPWSVLPALALLPHTVHLARPSVGEFLSCTRCDAVLVDGRQQPYFACELSRQVVATGRRVPTIGVIEEEVAPEVGDDCAIVQLVMWDAGPAEIDARLRLARPDRTPFGALTSHGSVLSVGPLEIDAESYIARADGRLLDLTHAEFELLNALALHAGRVLTRHQVLQEVWGWDYDQHPRTVDAHVRALRAKLGVHRDLIRTVRGIGYTVARPRRS